MGRNLLHLALGFLLSAAGMELALRLLPVSTGYALGAVDERRPIPLGTARFHYTYSRDWSFHLANSGALNNFGLRSSYDYRPDPQAVVLIGNSYVQADALDPRQAMAERMRAVLQRPVYALGVDGFSLADYLATARWANATFATRTVLVLLTTGDLDHSCSRRPGQHYLSLAGGKITLSLLSRAAPSALKRALNDSRLFRYVYDNLAAAAGWSKGWRRDDRGAADPRAAGAARSCGGADFAPAATQFLLESFRALADTAHVRLIFLVAPGYRREQGLEPGAIRDVDRFADSAQRRGFEVVPLAAAFAPALESGERLDFLPIDGHWNAAAHAIAAAAADEALGAGVNPSMGR